MAPKSKKRKASELDATKSPQSNTAADGRPEAATQSPSSPKTEYAMIPFRIHLDPAEGPLPAAKRRKGVIDDKFGPHLQEGVDDAIKVRYTVRPGSKWQAMRQYRNFIISEKKFGVGDYIYINHSAMPQNVPMANISASYDQQNFWPAKVLEVRASDAQHVYLRVIYLYWPEELPMGRQDYHGKSEVIMSNYMEIMDAMTVACGVEDLKHWHEGDDDDDHGPLFFRQYFNFLTGKLSDIRKHCICGGFYNPDRTLIGCSNESCKTWMHEECVIDDVLARVYARLVPEPASSPGMKLTINGTPVKGTKTISKRASKGTTISAKKHPWEGKFTASINTQKAGETGKVTVVDERGQDPETLTEEIVCLKCGSIVQD